MSVINTTTVIVTVSAATEKSESCKVPFGLGRCHSDSASQNQEYGSRIIAYCQFSHLSTSCYRILPKPVFEFCHQLLMQFFLDLPSNHCFIRRWLLECSFTSSLKPAIICKLKLSYHVLPACSSLETQHRPRAMISSSQGPVLSPTIHILY